MQVNPESENSQVSLSPHPTDSLELWIFNEKPPKPGRAPGLPGPNSSDALCLQRCCISPLKHFFEVYYRTLWLWAWQMSNCRTQWISSGRVPALRLEETCRQKAVIKPQVRAVPRVPSIPSENAAFSCWPPSQLHSFRIQQKWISVDNEENFRGDDPACEDSCLNLTFDFQISGGA